MTTIVGVDPSLTSLGLAVTDGMTIKTARVRTRGSTADSLRQRGMRQDKIVASVMEFVDKHDAGLVVIEGPSYGSKFGHPHDRSGLWWAIVKTLLANPGCHVVEVPPVNRIKYATGKGRADKDVVLAAAIRRYPQADITGNDVADAVILAAMGARYLGAVVEESLPQTHLEAMVKVTWQVSPD